MEIFIPIALGISLLVFSFMFLLQKVFQTNSKAKKKYLPTNWPVVGMLPGLLMNLYRLHDFLTEIMEHSNGTFILKGPWLSNILYLVTIDPNNIVYILSRNVENFPKGPDFKKFFDDLGDGIFIADGASWHLQRKTALRINKEASFENFVASVTWEKCEAGLMPILTAASETEGMEIDMQDLFDRLAFDCTSIMAFGNDSNTLRADLPFSPEIQAFRDGLEAVLQRHALPETIWKIQKWINVGKEKKLARSRSVLNPYVYDSILLKRQKFKETGEHDGQDLLTRYMKIFPEGSDLFFRDTMINFIFAGKDTLSSSLTWFFYMMAKYPEHQNKIREETIANSADGKWVYLNLGDLKKSFYLHAALCETLRLFPSVPINHKAPVKPDMLPSGHAITTNTKTILPVYSMGRLESIWGKDCLEFKPERWIAENGKDIKSVPAYKFTAFSSGARSCIGKDMSFIQLKIVTAAIISRFHIQLVEGHVVAPTTSIILQMTHGLKVKVSKYVS